MRSPYSRCQRGFSVMSRLINVALPQGANTAKWG